MRLAALRAKSATKLRSCRRRSPARAGWRPGCRSLNAPVGPFRADCRDDAAQGVLVAVGAQAAARASSRDSRPARYPPISGAWPDSRTSALAGWPRRISKLPSRPPAPSSRLIEVGGRLRGVEGDGERAALGVGVPQARRADHAQPAPVHRVPLLLRAHRRQAPLGQRLDHRPQLPPALGELVQAGGDRRRGIDAGDEAVVRHLRQAGRQQVGGDARQAAAQVGEPGRARGCAAPARSAAPSDRPPGQGPAPPRSTGCMSSSVTLPVRCASSPPVSARPAGRLVVRRVVMRALPCWFLPHRARVARRRLGLGRQEQGHQDGPGRRHSPGDERADGQAAQERVGGRELQGLPEGGIAARRDGARGDVGRADGLVRDRRDLPPGRACGMAAVSRDPNTEA